MKRIAWQWMNAAMLSVTEKAKSRYTDVYLVDLRLLSAEDWIFLAMHLKETELFKARNYQQESDRRCYIAGRSVLRQLLAAYAELPFEELFIQKDKRGNPFVEGVPVAFNVAHLGDMILLAFRKQAAHLRVGVDLEKVRSQYDAYTIARHYCSPPEQLLKESPENAPVALDRWAKGTATFEAKGIKQVDEMMALEVAGAVNQMNRQTEVALQPSGDGLCYIYTFKLGQKYVGSIALEGAHGGIRFYRWG